MEDVTGFSPCRIHICFLHVSSAVSLQGPNAGRLYNDLMRDYNRLLRPVANDSDNITVEFGVTFNQIIDVVREPSPLPTFSPID